MSTQNPAHAAQPLSRTRGAFAAVALTLGAAWTALSPAVAAAQVVPAPVVEQRYGSSSWGSFPLQNYNGVSSFAFDDNAVSMTGQLGRKATNSLTFGSVQQTSLTSVQAAAIEVRFAQSGWVNDQIVLEYTIDNWRTARHLATFGAGAPPPAALTTFRYAGLESVITSPAKANAVQIRLRAGKRTGDAETLTLNVDQVRLVLAGA